MEPPFAESLALAIARASAWGPGLGLVAPWPTMVFWSDATMTAPTGGLGARFPAAFSARSSARWMNFMMQVCNRGNLHGWTGCTGWDLCPTHLHSHATRRHSGESRNPEGNQWIGIDLSALAVKLVEQRARNELGLMDGIQAIARTDIPKRTDREPAPPLNESKVVLYGTQGGNRNGCGTHFLPQHMTVDHIIARSKGGTGHLGNLQLLCGHCNSLKGNRPMEYLRARLVREYV